MCYSLHSHEHLPGNVKFKRSFFIVMLRIGTENCNCKQANYQAKLLDLLQQNPLKEASLISFKKKKCLPVAQFFIMTYDEI